MFEILFLALWVVGIIAIVANLLKKPEKRVKPKYYIFDESPYKRKR